MEAERGQQRYSVGMLGILMLIHHWDEVQGSPANNGAGARVSGQGAGTAGRLRHPGARLCLQGASEGI